MKQELLKKMKTFQLKSIGYIKRHDSLLKTILESRVEGKRTSGKEFTFG
jgi:hypothetical protein